MIMTPWEKDDTGDAKRQMAMVTAAAAIEAEIAITALDILLLLMVVFGWTSDVLILILKSGRLPSVYGNTAKPSRQSLSIGS